MGKFPPRVSIAKTRGQNSKYLPLSIYLDEGEKPTLGLEYLSLEEHEAQLAALQEKCDRYEKALEKIMVAEGRCCYIPKISDVNNITIDHVPVAVQHIAREALKLADARGEM